MPYITDRARWELAKGDKVPSNPGELNYTLTTIVHDYLVDNGESYQTYNDIIGALESAKLELYRRKVASYEDVKIRENGDV